MDIKEKYQLTSERLNDPLGMEAFDHSYGWFVGGGIFCWKNRHGGKTFIYSSGEDDWTPIDCYIVCSGDMTILSISELSDNDEVNEEYKKDGFPAFLLPEQSDLEILIRKLCLRITGGYVGREDFLERFLTASDPDDSDDMMLRRDYGLQNALAPELIKLPYPKFLESGYWRVVKKVMRARHATCQMCGCKHGLEVHHKTYKHHGLELQYLDDLMLVCRDCHQKIHDKEKVIWPER